MNPTQPAPVAQPTQPAPVAQPTEPAPAVITAEVPPAPKEIHMPKRKLTKLKDRQQAIIKDITELPSLDLEAIKAIVIKHTSPVKAPKKAKDLKVAKDSEGVDVYKCNRSKQWFYIEDMVVNPDGQSRGYSKASHDLLTRANLEIRQIADKSQNLLLDGKGGSTEALELAQRRNAVENAKSSLVLYANIKGTAVPNLGE